MLHEDLEINDLEFGKIDKYTIASAALGMNLQEITIPLAEKIATGESVTLNWKYEGELKNDRLLMEPAIITEQWTELPVEGMWIPVEASLENRFTFDALVDIPEKEEYELISNGIIDKKTPSEWGINSSIASPDIPIILSEEMLSQRYDDNSEVAVHIHHGGTPDSILDYVSEHTTEIVQSYTDHFGGNQLAADELRIAVSPIERELEFANSYARPGFISLQHIMNTGPELFAILAHESAHLWWLNSIDPHSYHNFLNEAFAEYISWLELKRVYGNEAFDKKLGTAQKIAENTPGLDEWTPENNGPLIYMKGAVLLYELNEKIGDSDFHAFLKELQNRRTGTIEEMISVLREVKDESVAEWFETMLFSSGI